MDAVLMTIAICGTVMMSMFAQAFVAAREPLSAEQDNPAR
jgi:hypothetical protein